MPGHVGTDLPVLFNYGPCQIVGPRVGEITAPTRAAASAAGPLWPCSVGAACDTMTGHVEACGLLGIR
jgi:hypothetical protein